MFGAAIGNGGGGLFASSFLDNGAYGGNGRYGGGVGSFGGGGNHSDSDDGGFGGGGGGGYYYGGYSGKGGFGGGGGGGGANDGYTNGSEGGFGGGGGYGEEGGYGGGSGNGILGSGGGAGFGGAIFAMKGVTNLKDVSFSNNSVVAGIGGNDGSAEAKNVFICTSDLDSLTASACEAVVNQCGTTNTTETIGELSACYVLPTNKWHQISLPRDSGLSTVNEIFGDDGLGTYGAASDWIIYRYNASANTYVALTLTDTLSQGVGYWIIQQTGSDQILDMPTDSEITPTTEPTHCIGSDCFEVSLETTAGGVEWNMIGYPFVDDGMFLNSRIVTTAAVCTPCTVNEAEVASIFHNQLFHYNDPVYVAVDIASDTLTPWHGYWTATLGSADGTEPTLLISKP